MSTVPAAKDINELYLLDPANFVANLERARARAVPFAALQADRRDRDRAESAAGCAELAAQPRILDVFDETLGEIGHVGEVSPQPSCISLSSAGCSPSPFPWS